MKQVKIKIKQTQPGNLPYVVLYHGKNGYRFLIDTGSTSTWIDPQCICQFLFEGEVSYEKLNEFGETKQVFPSTLRVKPVNHSPADYEQPKFRAEFICEKLENLNYMNGYISEPLHGILGMDFLSGNSMKVDLKNLELIA
jgi:hypothetical protein